MRALEGAGYGPMTGFSRRKECFDMATYFMYDCDDARIYHEKGEQGYRESCRRFLRFATNAGRTYPKSLCQLWGALVHVGFFMSGLYERNSMWGRRSISLRAFCNKGGGDKKENCAYMDIQQHERRRVGFCPLGDDCLLLHLA